MKASPIHADGTQGSSLVETAVLMPVMLLMLVGGVDFGRACYLGLEVSAAAEAGASYGAANATDTAGMIAAAKLEVPDSSGLTPVATYGCECSDGSSPVSNCGTAPTCAYNVLNYVQVSTTLTYTPLLPYPGIPSSIKLTSLARMRAAH